MQAMSQVQGNIHLKELNVHLVIHLVLIIIIIIINNHNNTNIIQTKRDREVENKQGPAYCPL